MEDLLLIGAPLAVGMANLLLTACSVHLVVNIMGFAHPMVFLSYPLGMFGSLVMGYFTYRFNSIIVQRHRQFQRERIENGEI
jgi:hypothetical protein